MGRSDHKLTDEQFRLLLDLWMMLDPSPLDEEGRRVFGLLLGDEADARGFDSKAEAYHEFADGWGRGATLFDRRDSETFRRAVETWGIEAQMDMAVEECGEVIVALQHHQRDRIGREEVIEELADLRIVFEQLRWYFGEDYVDPMVREKMDRLRARLPGE